MMGRYILPWFGGGPAVWTTCLLFFQICLLAGYAYAHWLGSRSNVRFHTILHIALLAASLLLLPIAPRADLWKTIGAGDPTFRIMILLTVSVGGPYILLSATAPLLQRWYTMGEAGQTPWRLYALSNLGSFLALLAYPFLFEPFLRLYTQGWIWSSSYVLFAAACATAAWRIRSAGSPAVVDDRKLQEAPARPRITDAIFWLLLAACGSALLMATTNQISEDIAVSPFLWVAALAVYLLTFVLTFESDRLYRRTPFAIAAGIVAPVACVLPSVSISVPLQLQLVLYLVAQFILCMLCHGELARSRPAPRYLTTFYFTLAAGGALGGAFVALIAPRVFSEFSEFPIGLALACLLGFIGWVRTGALQQWNRGDLSFRLPFMALLIGGLTGLVAAGSSAKQGAVATVRNFYGILRVMDLPGDHGAFRELQHGRIRHGMEFLASDRLNSPTSYYGPHSGVAIALNALDGPHRRVGVVGLGAGTLAAWGHSGDTFRFYEINPAVEPIARSWFSFLARSAARTQVVLGDARVELERELASGHSHDFDLIAVDAFSSDSIPVHLLTAECADVYRSRLAPGGVLALHISNRVLNLDPIARGMAQHLGWTAVPIFAPDNPSIGESTSRWVLMAADAAFLQRAGIAQRTSQWTDRAPIVWTDDFSSLWHVLNF
jgi:spermidine synthase